MNRDDIYRLARDAFLMDKHDCSDDWFVRADIDEKNVVEFAALVVAAEREACARIFEEDSTLDGQDRWELAELIRARGEEQTPQERTPDYLEKCPNCNGPADNGFDRSWPDPNPYFCTKCMKAMEY